MAVPQLWSPDRGPLHQSSADHSWTIDKQKRTCKEQSIQNSIKGLIYKYGIILVAFKNLRKQAADQGLADPRIPKI